MTKGREFGGFLSGENIRQGDLGRVKSKEIVKIGEHYGLGLKKPRLGFNFIVSPPPPPPTQSYYSKKRYRKFVESCRSFPMLSFILESNGGWVVVHVRNPTLGFLSIEGSIYKGPAPIGEEVGYLKLIEWFDGFLLKVGEFNNQMFGGEDSSSDAVYQKLPGLEYFRKLMAGGPEFLDGEELVRGFKYIAFLWASLIPDVERPPLSRAWGRLKNFSFLKTVKKNRGGENL